MSHAGADGHRAKRDDMVSSVPPKVFVVQIFLVTPPLMCAFRLSVPPPQTSPPLLALVGVGSGQKGTQYRVSTQLGMDGNRPWHHPHPLCLSLRPLPGCSCTFSLDANPLGLHGLAGRKGTLSTLGMSRPGVLALSCMHAQPTVWCVSHCRGHWSSTSCFSLMYKANLSCRPLWATQGQHARWFGPSH